MPVGLYVTAADLPAEKHNEVKKLEAHLGGFIWAIQTFRTSHGAADLRSVAPPASHLGAAASPLAKSVSQ